MSPRGNKLAHVMIPVADPDRAVRGVDVDAEVSRFGNGVAPMFWFRDPEANVLPAVEGK